MAEAGRDNLKTGRLLAYAGPSVALHIMMIPLLLFLPPYYSTEIGIEYAVIGPIFLLARLWDAFTDPVIGSLSDRTSSRFGRRRVWILAGLPLVLVSGYMLLSPPAGATWLYLLVWITAFYIFWTMVFIPYQSWGAEISPNFEERTRVAGFREGGSFAGYLLGSLIPFVLLELILGIEAPSFGQMLDVLLWCFLLGLPLAVLVSFRVVGEKSGSIGGTINWRQLYSIPVRNRPFLRLMTAYLLDRTSMGIYLAANPYVITYLLGLFDDFLIIALLMSVVAVAFCPFWVVVARRLGKHTTYCIANGITVAGYALFLFVPTSSLAWTLPIFVVLGIGNAGTLILPPSMTADAVDYDQLRTGVAQTGGHMAFLNLITKVGLALGIGVTSAVLWLFGFDESAAVQDEASLTGLRATIGLVPSLLILPAIWLMATFPLDSRRHGIIRRRLAGRAGHSHSGY